jgi:hypothetical protein
MSNKLKLSLIFFLQFIPIILYPPETLKGGLVVILVVVGIGLFSIARSFLGFKAEYLPAGL